MDTKNSYIALWMGWLFTSDQSVRDILTIELSDLREKIQSESSREEWELFCMSIPGYNAWVTYLERKTILLLQDAVKRSS